MGFFQTINKCLLLLLLLCTFFGASARASIFFSDEKGIRVTKPRARMLRMYYIDDYGNPQANSGHDPGNRMGSGGRHGRRRSNRP
ncbi:uncharacterized protein LOC130814237 [Amaranthus tricolor]|uniref:uncharacterized protein LOC130814237 n=1 Tax=Amaranthus tricolor TaxID=29722 RepID=UPI002583F96A|nr:uncharacterized protein LOC130814237 [Amaranthus tricolor]